MSKKLSRALLLLLIINVIITVSGLTIAVYATRVGGNAAKASYQASSPDISAGLMALAAGVAVAGSTIGAGIALSGVVTAGFAAIVEKPELKTWMLIFTGLAEGIAIYGLMIALMVLGRI